MSDFKNVSIKKSANIFFDGKVTSRNIEFEDGSRKTLGIMLPGEYQFNTISKEIMEINSGALEYKIPNCDWVKIVAPGVFEVPSNAKFEIRILSLVDYCCSFIK
ncbi:MAG: pyrimidine/purine nucleoside phosphorylase [Arcobacteraceae bacterium]